MSDEIPSKEQPLLSGVLRRRWRVEALVVSSHGWYTYSVEDIRTLKRGFLIQRCSASSTDQIKWKGDFAKYCSERSGRRDWPVPAVLDRFTEGNYLCLIEASPEAGWNALKFAPPPDPEAWTLAFFRGLDTLGSYGNPDLSNLYSRGSEILFCCGSFPQLDGTGNVGHDPKWVRQVIETAFGQTLVAIMTRRTLNSDLRGRIEAVLPEATLTDLPVSKPLETTLPAATITPVRAPKPPEPGSAELIQATQRASDFARGFAVCCGHLFSQGNPVPSALVQQSNALHQHLLTPASVGLSEQALRNWIVSWWVLAYESCALLADSMDTQAGRPLISDATAEYRDLVRMANLTEIRPSPNDVLSWQEHDQIGQPVPPTDSDQSGHVARVRTPGFRQGGQVLRKATVLVFDRHPISPPMLPTRTKTSKAASVIALVLGFALTLLAIWLWHHHTAPNSALASLPHPNGVGNDGRAGGSVDTLVPIPKSPPEPPSAPPVQPTPAPSERVQIKDFTVPSEVEYGRSVTLSWEVLNADTIQIIGLSTEPEDVAPSGSVTRILAPDIQQLVLEARGKGENNSTSAARPISFKPVMVDDFRADPSPVSYGDPFTLSWSVRGVPRVRIDRSNGGSLPTQGVQNSLTIETQGVSEYVQTFTLTPEGPKNPPVTTITEKIVPKIVNFSAAEYPVGVGQCKAWILRWTVQGAASVVVDQRIGVKKLSDYAMVVPVRSTTYTLTATNPGGSASQPRTIDVPPGVQANCR